MPLTDTLAPERIILTLGKNGGGVQTIHGEQTGIPTYGDHSNVTAGGSRSIYSLIMGRDIGMGIKAVNDVEIFCKLGCHFRQIGSTAAAEDHNINLILPFFGVLDGNHGNIGCLNFHSIRTAAGKDSLKLHIRVLVDGTFHTLCQVAVAHNSNVDHSFNLFLA